MPRDNNEQPTNNDIIVGTTADADTYAAADDLSAPVYTHDIPRVLPDHGPRLRIVRPDEQTYAARGSQDYLYRPASHPDPFRDLRGEDWRTAAEERRDLAFRALTKLVRDTAPRLSWFRDDAVAARIKEDVVDPAGFILKDAVPPAEIPAIMNHFVAMLLSEIARHKKKPPYH